MTGRVAWWIACFYRQASSPSSHHCLPSSAYMRNVWKVSQCTPIGGKGRCSKRYNAYVHHMQSSKSADERITLAFKPMGTVTRSVLFGTVYPNYSSFSDNYLLSRVIPQVPAGTQAGWHMCDTCPLLPTHPCLLVANMHPQD